MRETGLVIATGVAALTKSNDDSYEDYIRKIPDFYVKIKLADITDNLCREPSERQKEKYRKAMKILVMKRLK